MEIALDHANKAHAEAKKAIKRTQNNLADVNQSIQDERKATNEIRETLGLTERKANAAAGELDESKALLEAAIRAQRQVEQELQDTREQVSQVEGHNTQLTNQKRHLEGDISQMRADLENMLANVRNSEDKARKAMVDAGRLADELRTEQDHASGLERAVRGAEMALTDMTVRAEEAAAAAVIAAQQLPAKLEARIREVEHELGRTIQVSSDYHKQVVKGERRVKELQFQCEEDTKNQV